MVSPMQCVSFSSDRHSKIVGVANKQAIDSLSDNEYFSQKHSPRFPIKFS